MRFAGPDQGSRRCCGWLTDQGRSSRAGPSWLGLLHAAFGICSTTRAVCAQNTDIEKFNGKVRDEGLTSSDSNRLRRPAKGHPAAARLQREAAPHFAGPHPAGQVRHLASPPGSGFHGNQHPRHSGSSNIPFPGASQEGPCNSPMGDGPGSERGGASPISPGATWTLLRPAPLAW